MVTTTTGFVAYPSRPPEIGQAITTSIHALADRLPSLQLEGWEENDIAGRFIAQPILEKIANAQLLVADITRLNFNVTFEIGYAIGRNKRVVLVLNSALVSDRELCKDVGIYDTIGFHSYSTSDQLAAFLSSQRDLAPLAYDSSINRKSPVYLVLPPNQTDVELRIAARIKKARLGFRQFDPAESGRMPAPEAISQVASSIGVVLPLLAENRADAAVHNIRAAFVAGLVFGMEKVPLLLQAGHDPVPLDYRDLVSVFNRLDQIDEFVAEFAPQVTEQLQVGTDAPVQQASSFLAMVTLGSSIAENELRDLGHYYIEKDEFRRAQRGEVQVVVGRKGSGKTALFARLRDRLRRNQQRIVLDLQPQGFQLVKFKENVLKLMEEGTREHTVTAFWEYLLLLEVAYKLLEKDRLPHKRNHELFEPYRALEKLYRQVDYAAEGDFAERMQWLIQEISGRLDSQRDTHTGPITLSRPEITEVLYRHDVAKLRAQIVRYLELKEELWILFDNLDKGWPAAGLKDEDLLLIRCLLDAVNNLRRALAKTEIECNGVVFLRNDVFELLVDLTPDRGKLGFVTIDWTDPNELREVVRRRLVYSGAQQDCCFEDIWRRICISHYRGEETSQYLIDRCLMRPRCLIDLIGFCRSHAVNLNKGRIDEADIDHGVEDFSTDLVHNIGYELRDVFSAAEDALYLLVGCCRVVRKDHLAERLKEVRLSAKESDELFRLMLWYGVLGLVRDNEEVAYMYNVKYDMKRLLALVSKHPAERLRFEINPALWAGLEIDL